MKIFITILAEQTSSNNFNLVSFIKKKKLVCELMKLAIIFYLIILCQI